MAITKWPRWSGLFQQRTRARARRLRLGADRLSLDCLEARTLLSNVTWTGKADGTSWDVAGNWSDNAVPTANDDVTINLSGSPTIEIRSGTESVNSVTSTDPISISGGSLSVAANSTLSGGLTMTGGSLIASGSGVTFSITGTTSVAAASLSAENGATLSLSQLTSYSIPSGSGSSSFLASGAGAVLNLPALTGLGAVQNWLYIEAKQGGQTLLPALDSLASNTDYLQVIADGATSKIDLSALTALPVANSGDLSVTNQATVLDPKLTSLTNVSVTLDGTGTIATGQWATLTDDSITLTGGTYSFPGITDFNASSAVAQAGASLTLPALTAYSIPSGSGSNSFLASGTGAVVNLPALTSLGAVQNWLYVEAKQGGQTLLPALDSLASNSDYVQVLADGSGSKIDLSALVSLPVANSGDLSVTNQATVLDPKLTSLTDVAVTIDGTGTMAVSQWTTLVSSSVDVTGGTTTLSLLTSVSIPSGGGSMTLEATTPGATLSLPALTSLGQLQNWLYLEAKQGGQLLLPALAAVTSTSRYLQVIADGSGSKIDLSGLTSLDVGNSGVLSVTNQATILDPKLTSLTDVAVTIDGTGTMAVGQWTTLVSSSVDVTGGTTTLSSLTSVSIPSGGGTITLEATTPGATLSLPALTSLGTLQNWLYIEAKQGGRTLLPVLGSLASNSDYLQVIADGSGSKIDLSGLTSLDVGNSGVLSVTNQATILDPKLTSLTDVAVTIDGTGTMAVGQWTTLVSSSVDVTGGTTTLSSLTSVSIPSGGGTITLEATTPGATLSLPALTSLGTLQNWLYIEAKQGGQTLLPVLGSLASNSDYLQVIADGSGSKIDLSGLTSLDVGNSGVLSVTNQATILDPKLTSLTDVAVTIDGTGTMAVGQWTTLVSSSVDVTGGTTTLSSLTSVSIPSGGGTITLEATGAGTTFSLPALKGLGSLPNWLYLEAKQGGQLLLPALVTIAPPSQYVHIVADGAGSTINLSALTSFTGTGSSSLTITNGGTVIDPDLSGLNGVNLVGDSTGTFTITASLGLSITGGTTTIQVGTLVDQGDLSVQNGATLNLQGSFSVNGSGILTAAPASIMEISGDLLGTTKNSDDFNPPDTVQFDSGLGTTKPPQLLEAMSADLGAVQAGFVNNFAYGTIGLTSNTYVQLVDQSHNTTSTKPEAIYADELIVPSGATLDLNNLHLYVRGDQIGGTILGGTVTVVPSGGSIALNAPTPGTLTPAGAVDNWTFYGTAGESITIQLNPGTGGSSPAVSPTLNWGQVALLDSRRRHAGDGQQR